MVLAMKAVLIVFNQALSDQVLAELRRLHVKGFTKWDGLRGEGSRDGYPHLGSHAWPALNSAYLVITGDASAREIRERMESLDAQRPQQGLRVFSWTVDE